MSSDIHFDLAAIFCEPTLHFSSVVYLTSNAGQRAPLPLPGSQGDLLPFLKRSMAGVYEILCAIGQKRHAQSAAARIPSPAAAQVGLYMIVGPHMRRVLPGARW